MSSLRYKSCQKATHAENKSFIPGSSLNHNIGLLRLDSTGEITSAQQGLNCQNLTVNHDDLNPKDCQRHNQSCCKKITMGSLINSAGAYFDTATSYIGNLHPYKTSRGLVKSPSDNSSFSYLKKILSGVSKPSHTSLNSVSGLDTQSDFLEQPCRCEEIDKTMSWTGNIFGALQNSLLSNCPAKSGKMKHVNAEKYVPPQRRYNQGKTRNVTSVVDPTLTPYNAKLLEKSKRLHSHSNAKKDIFTENCPQKVHKTNGLIKFENNVEKKCEENVKNCSPDQETALDCTPASTVSGELESICEKVFVDDQTETSNSETETDWFDYECDNAKCIPVSMEKFQLASQKCTKNDNIKDSDTNMQQFHSWFSIEGNDAANTNSSLSKNECDKNNTSDLKRKENSQLEEKMPSNTGKCAEIKNSENIDSEQHYNKSKPKSQEINEADNNYNVLYLRSFGRRGRPSAKKRRRQKAQQNEAQPSSDKSSSGFTPNSALCPNSAVAFILGYSTDKSEEDSHSFHVSCDIEGDSDWSDSDFESDENLSSLDDETMMFGSGLGFQCNDPLNNMQCFTVKCTMQPSDESLSNSSAIDKINLSWRVQVSVEPESPKKKSPTTKKVHFADDNDLFTVHPIIAWSHAYQAARKGPWEQYARDRGRFLRRITDGETLLKPVLHKNHRDRIFRERFSKQ